MAQEIGWNVHIELHSDGVPESALDEIRDALYEFRASTGFILGNGNVSVTFGLDATTAQEATDRAVCVVTRAARTAGVPDTVLCVEVMTETERERQNREPLVLDLAGVSEIGEILGVTRQRAKQISTAPGLDFPPPVAVIKAGPVFARWQVEAFENRWTRKPGRPGKAA